MAPLLVPTISIELDCKRQLVFDLNTFAAYEESTGKCFFETLAKLMEATRPLIPEVAADGSVVGGRMNLSPMQIVRSISVQDLRAVIWAALIEYDKQDNPIWPLTLYQVGKLIHIGNIVPILMAVMTGEIENRPTEEERIAVGETSGVPGPAPVRVLPLTGGDGGDKFGL